MKPAVDSLDNDGFHTSINPTLATFDFYKTHF
jgi:hypothetical protein